MSSALHRLGRPLVDRATYRRWAFLVLGGALLVPYVVLANALGVLIDGFTSDPDPLARIVMAVGTLAALVATASVPAVRAVMATGAKELLRGPMAGLAPGRGRSWSHRLRCAGWLLVHVLAGGLISALSVAVPVMTVVALIAPFAGPDVLRDVIGGPLPAAWRASWAPVAGVLAVLVLIYLAAALGALLARLGPVLLGPSADERIAAAERRAGDLAQRNRLARELHDSVGHALSIVTTQAGAPAVHQRQRQQRAREDHQRHEDREDPIEVLQGPGVAQEALEHLRADTRQAAGDRQVPRGIRPPGRGIDPPLRGAAMDPATARAGTPGAALLGDGGCDGRNPDDDAAAPREQGAPVDPAHLLTDQQAQDAHREHERVHQHPNTGQPANTGQQPPSPGTAISSGSRADQHPGDRRQPRGRNRHPAAWEERLAGSREARRATDRPPRMHRGIGQGRHRRDPRRPPRPPWDHEQYRHGPRRRR